MPKLLQAFEPGTARAQKLPQQWYPKMLRGAFCAAVRADAESASEAGRTARRRRASWGCTRGLEVPGTLF
eukprot:1025954-Alexandrium_andersonii.AAC.1